VTGVTRVTGVSGVTGAWMTARAGRDNWETSVAVDNLPV
jgi:hypothetical protein